MSKEKTAVSKRIRIAAVLLILAALGGAATAWYFYQRQAAGVVPIDSPVSIYINAAHKEAVENLDLSGIDMEREDGHGNRYNYQDFAFTVQGEDVNAFYLQLAYTTNNQLSFEIYEATENSGAGGLVTYYSMAEDALYSYNILGSRLDMVYLNKDGAAAEKLADGTLHGATYGAYGNVQKYAEPIYCKTRDPIATRNHSGIKFHNYFILRVMWPDSRMNDRETDMVYISAKVGNAN